MVTLPATTNHFRLWMKAQTTCEMRIQILCREQNAASTPVLSSPVPINKRTEETLSTRRWKRKLYVENR